MISSTRDATATFYGYLRGLFQSDRATMLRMGEVSRIDHQAMQHMLTSSAINNQKLHSYLDYKSPNQYDAEAAKSIKAA